MTNYAEQFVVYLQDLAERDSAAMARLRRSLSADPGTDPAVYPYIERFVHPDWDATDARRLALYVAGGLFAMHPRHGAPSFGQSFGVLRQRRDSDSLEKRFVALLAAEADDLPVHLRHATSLLRAEDLAVDYSRLLKDLSRWLNPYLEQSQRDRLRQRWARDFYRVITAETNEGRAAPETVQQATLVQ